MKKRASSVSAQDIPMQAPDPGAELFTVAEAAKLLKVSTTTLHRWLKQGRLHAYRVGPRAVRVHRADLAKLLVPTADLRVPLLTEAEATAALVALKDAQALTAAIQHQRGQPLSASWSLIRHAREERATRL